MCADAIRDADFRGSTLTVHETRVCADLRSRFTKRGFTRSTLTVSRDADLRGVTLTVHETRIYAEQRRRLPTTRIYADLRLSVSRDADLRGSMLTIHETRFARILR